MKFYTITLFLLATLIGVEIALGIFVAPTLFFPSKIIGEGVLTHFQSGQLMTQIFLKFNTLLLAVSALVFVYEGLNLATNKSQSFNMRFSAFMLAAILLMLALVFAFYFTTYIVDAQKFGAQATQTEAFYQMHKASEHVMKIMIIAQILLFFIRFPRQKA